MTYITAVLLGLIQGLTEFLPVSSSGHLILFENLFGLMSAEETNLFFDVLLHFGTLIAVFIAFRKDIVEVVLEFFRFFRDLFRGEKKELPPARRFLLLLIVATVPLILVLPVKGVFESIRTRPWLVGVMLLVTGAILFISDRMKKGHKTERSATVVDALIVGLFQAIAVTPGLSRSGTTISAGLIRGFDRKFAVRFSFLLSIPAVLGATVLETADAVKAGIDTSLLPMYLVGMVVAAVSGFFAIKLVRWLMDSNRFGVFAYYCFAVGAVSIVASLVGGAK